MTQTRFFVLRLAKIFGYSRKNSRLTDAATETHLLKEAETHLGRAVWKDVENIENISVEYWNLRNFAKERDRVAEELKECKDYLDQAHEERAGLLNANSDAFQDLIKERKTIFAEMETAARERDMVISKAREVRRSYDGLKMKLEVLTNEGDHTDDELDRISCRMAELKLSFADLKEERTTIADKIDIGHARIDEIEIEIDTRKKDRRGQASEAFQDIGDANQRLSSLGSEMGLLNSKMDLLFSQIGRHVSRQSHVDPACREVTKKYKGMVEVMHALRRSIQFNHQLAER